MFAPNVTRCLHTTLLLDTGSLSAQSRLRGVPELRNVKGDGAKLLQLARSTPFVTCTLVGHKTLGNVERNLDLSQVPLVLWLQFV